MCLIIDEINVAGRENRLEMLVRDIAATVLQNLCSESIPRHTAKARPVEPAGSTPRLHE
ncbi:hypothetical protein AG1IA_06112 [Rhizoctonia solani AG-1 IA]|uniref:Uncharacterized protein n=1 Tax=Thanatephorus cucumeris (strain AG1-IA) TaxID=983506 RepID=L8WPG1_THACA|nr:hypothetical protein AG1IA_06112 [Rhizoctonia solani AG-1 IA]